MCARRKAIKQDSENLFRITGQNPHLFQYIAHFLKLTICVTGHSFACVLISLIILCCTKHSISCIMILILAYLSSLLNDIRTLSSHWAHWEAEVIKATPALLQDLKGQTGRRFCRALYRHISFLQVAQVCIPSSLPSFFLPFIFNSIFLSSLLFFYSSSSSLLPSSFLSSFHSPPFFLFFLICLSQFLYFLSFFPFPFFSHLFSISVCLYFPSFSPPTGPGSLLTIFIIFYVDFYTQVILVNFQNGTLLWNTCDISIIVIQNQQHGSKISSFCDFYRQTARPILYDVNTVQQMLADTESIDVTDKTDSKSDKPDEGMVHPQGKTKTWFMNTETKS